MPPRPLPHFPVSRQQWTDARVVAEIRSRHKRGEPLTTTEVIASDEALMGAARRYFGSWRDALEASALEPQTRDCPIGWEETPAGVQRKIHARAATGESLAAHHVPSSLYFGAVHHYGSWAAAIETAGLDYATIRLTRVWSPERIVHRIKALAQAGVELSVSTVEVVDAGLVAAGVYHFGNWESALKKADVANARRTERWTRERVLLVARVNGPFTGGWRRAAERLFGSTDAAKEAAASDAQVVVKLREVRKAHKVSQTALGRQLGVSHRTIGLWETGKVRLTLVRVLELAEALDCRLDELVELQKPPASP